MFIYILSYSIILKCFLFYLFNDLCFQKLIIKYILMRKDFTHGKISAKITSKVFHNFGSFTCNCWNSN